MEDCIDDDLIEINIKEEKISQLRSLAISNYQSSDENDGTEQFSEFSEPSTSSNNKTERKSRTQRNRRRNESPASREKRLLKQSEADHRRRATESPTSRERRLAKQREYDRRRNESPASRELRLSKQREYIAKVRAEAKVREESPDSRERRLQKQREEDRRRNESPESRERRLSKQREYNRRVRGTAEVKPISKDERHKRRLRKLRFDRKRRAESPASRELRLQKQREYDRRVRGYKGTRKKSAEIEEKKPNVSDLLDSIDTITCRFCLAKYDATLAKDIPDAFVKLYEKYFDDELDQDPAFSRKLCYSCSYKAKDLVRFLNNVKENQPKLGDVTISAGKEPLLEVEIDSAAMSMQMDPIGGYKVGMMEVKAEQIDDNDPFDVDDNFEMMRDESDEDEDVKGNFPLIHPMVDEVEIPIKSERREEVQILPPPTHQRIRPFTKRLRTTKFVSAHPQSSRYKRGTRSCDICGFQYNTHGGIRKHIEDDHFKKNLPPDRPYKCPECVEYFTSHYHLMKHKARMHFDPSNFVCGECGKQFADKGTLNVHKRKTHSPKVICTYCAEYIRQGLMAQHIRELHQPCECEYCGQKFDGQRTRNTHRENVHGNAPQACPHCKNVFKNIRLLRNHLTTVHKETQLPCLVEGCNFVAQNRGNMKFHILHHKDLDSSLRERLLVEIDLFRAARVQMNN